MHDRKEQTDSNSLPQEPVPPNGLPTQEATNIAFPISIKPKYLIVVLALFGITIVGVGLSFFFFSGRTRDQTVISKSGQPDTTNPSIAPQPADISQPSIEYPDYEYEPAIELLGYGKTHHDAQEKISFKYPANLVPLEHGQGVVAFFKSENDMLACKTKSEEYACYKRFLTYNGTRRGAYAEIPDDIYDPHTFTDDRGRIWTVEVLMAAATNYTAYTTINGEKVLFAMQGDPRGGIEGFSKFADQIVSTFELTD